MESDHSGAEAFAYETGIFFSVLIERIGCSTDEATRITQSYVAARVTQHTILEAVSKVVAAGGTDEPWRPEG